MTDSIEISGLVVDTRLGVTAAERATPQDVVIDVSIRRDLSGAATTDDLESTVDYDALIGEIAALARAGERNLLERLASEICDLVSAKDGVSGVTVRVGKKVVPVAEQVSAVVVSIERGS